VLKIAALDAHEPELWRLAEGVPVIVSRRTPANAEPGVLQLFCPKGYPQEPGDFCRALVDGRWDGVSYHGTDEQMVMALALQAPSIVEVHLHLETEPSELEAGVSLTEYQLQEVVEWTRKIGL
jgi:hypothetical protein